MCIRDRPITIKSQSMISKWQKSHFSNKYKGRDQLETLSLTACKICKVILWTLREISPKVVTIKCWLRNKQLIIQRLLTCKRFKLFKPSWTTSRCRTMQWLLVAFSLLEATRQGTWKWSTQTTTLRDQWTQCLTSSSMVITRYMPAQLRDRRIKATLRQANWAQC